MRLRICSGKYSQRLVFEKKINKSLHVVEVLIGLAHSGDSKHKVSKDAGDVDGMSRRQPQKSLQVERVQLADQKLERTYP